jgi:hypothetical protein
MATLSSLEEKTKKFICEFYENGCGRNKKETAAFRVHVCQDKYATCITRHDLLDKKRVGKYLLNTARIY